MNCDVAIIGGGPGGSTIGSYLRKYGPNLNVQIFERETFPRDHVGESQLPTISHYLDELGVWDKVEAAGFPIKVGATYKWGKTKELWDFDFISGGQLKDAPRPEKFEGQRRFTAFQVDRAIYDEILLDHASELGCSVHEGAKVDQVVTEGDKVSYLKLADGQEIHARYYMDASGHTGVIRRAFGVPVEYPTTLQNIAVWDYWENAEWAETVGLGGTRVQVMSLGYGWIWFIPIGPTRTSIGLIVPADYYKQTGKRPRDLYAQALQEEERVAHLIRNATCEDKLQSTKDWSFLSSRLYGENWFLVGESAGFADPILAAGMSITHASAREAALTILALDKGDLDSIWLKDEYQRLQVNRIRNHIRFADYWYSANTQFADLQEHTAEIAAQNGLDLSPQKAWQWLAQGGFIDDDLVAGTATLSLSAIKSLGKHMSPMDVEDPLSTNNVFRLNLEGAQTVYRAAYEGGNIRRYKAFVRENKMFPIENVYKAIYDILVRHQKLPEILREVQLLGSANKNNETFKIYVLNRIPVALEALIHSGWITASYDPSLPLARTSKDTQVMRWHVDKNEELAAIATKEVSPR